jgi:N6-L-threonylcarbamoyladenine synthase
VVEGGRVLSNVIASQTALHAPYGGVVPELAAREHLRNLGPVIHRALGDANVGAAELQAVAATRGPGLPSALMAGLKAAQALAFSLRKPFLGVHHHEAHLFSPCIGGDPPAAHFARFGPSVSLIVSGGHTLLVHVRSELDHQVLGSTLDDAAGECFDKIGKLMGLAYPAGPQMDRLAAGANPRAFQFPRPMLHDASDDFSFAGLKTSVRFFLQKHPALLESPPQVRNLCASVQAAIIEVLVAKTLRAALRLGVECIAVSGGVACNSALREQLAGACRREGLACRFAEKQFCTDNAAMIAVLAERKLAAGVAPTSLDADIQPNWPL